MILFLARIDTTAQQSMVCSLLRISSVSGQAIPRIVPAARIGMPGVIAALLFMAGHALGQEPADPAQAPAKQAESRKWEFEASATTYLLPDDREYIQPSFKADRGRLHLEARYNYEALRTGSLWAGYNFSVGDKVSFEFTPMIGGVFGDTNGVAPGFRTSLSWRRLALYSESEYVCNTEDHSSNFFYTWSELSYSPVDWFRFGLVGQRTRAYETELDLQRGPLFGFTYKRLNLGLYLFNLDREQKTTVFSVAVGF